MGDDRTPLTPEQLELLYSAINMVVSSPNGYGEVTIKVTNGHVRFIVPSFHLDLKYPEREERWIERDRDPSRSY